jgi:hypothetical protein
VTDMTDPNVFTGPDAWAFARAERSAGTRARDALRRVGRAALVVATLGLIARRRRR